MFSVNMQHAMENVTPSQTPVTAAAMLSQEEAEEAANLAQTGREWCPH